jgi:hypothetical protein
VRLVEAVPRELEDELEQFLGLPSSAQALAHRPFDELRALALMTFSFFLLMALMSVYAGAERDVAQLVHDLHDLFLVDHDAVRVAP